MSNFTIRSLLLKEMPGLREQYKRNFEITSLRDETASLMHALSNEVGEIKPEQIAAHVGGFLHYSATPVATPTPPGGWFTPRFSFVMHVEYRQASGTLMHYFVSGYTDRLVNRPVVVAQDQTPNQAMEAELDGLNFIINSVVSARDYTQRLPSGDVPTLMSLDDLHVHSDMGYTSVFRNDERHIELTRPEDLLARAQTLTIPRGDDTVKLIDTRTILTAPPRFSRRANVLPASLLARTAQAYTDTIRESTYGINHTEQLIEARGRARESLVSANPFLHMLATIRGGTSLQTFTFLDLKEIDGTVSERTVVALEGNALNTLVGEQNWTPWDDTTMESHIAYGLAVGVPAMMGESGVSFIDFTLRPQDNGYYYTVAEVGALAANDTEFALRMFKMNLFKQLMPFITGNDKIRIDVHMRVDRLGLSTLKLRIVSAELSEYKHYLIPSYMDALMSPVELPATVSGQSKLDRLAHDVTMLLSAVEDGALAGKQ